MGAYPNHSRAPKRLATDGSSDQTSTSEHGLIRNRDKEREKGH